MKTIALIVTATALLAFFGITIFKQEAVIPEEVVEAFLQKYPAAQSITWEEEGDEYEAEFKLGKAAMSASFAKNGEWLETETEIQLSELPAVVLEGIKFNFPNAELEEAEQLEQPNQDLAYEVELEGAQEDQEIEAVFSAEGRLLKTKINIEAAEEHDDDDN